MNFKEILSVSLILFSVIDILGSIPIIIDLRKKHGHVHSEKITIISGVLMVSFLFLGESILKLFAIDVGSFAISGAIIMFIIGMEMVLGLQFFKTDPEAEGSSTVTIVPIAFPLIAGAGTMTTLISLKAEYSNLNILIGVAVNLLLVYIVLKTSGWLEKRIGPAGFNILRKVFGIILLSISIKLFKNHWFL